MNNLPVFVYILFIATTFLTVWLFYKASGNSNKLLLYIGAWMFLQAVLALTGFYQKTDTMPPRFVVLLGPVILICFLTIFTNRGRGFAGSFQLDKLTLLHSVRIPVEITLFYVYLAGYIPKLMTFEGRNYDIISGISSLLIYYLVFIRKKPNRTLLLIWNFICLGLLINVLTIAVLSAQTPFQKLAFDQPNTGVAYFPFVWLPSVVVPIVLFSHLAGIMQLVKSFRKNESSDKNLTMAEM